MLCARSKVPQPGEHKSSPRPGSRDGMKQETLRASVGSGPRSQPKGKATGCRFSVLTPFLASQNWISVVAVETLHTGAQVSRDSMAAGLHVRRANGR